MRHYYNILNIVQNSKNKKELLDSFYIYTLTEPTCMFEFDEELEFKELKEDIINTVEYEIEYVEEYKNEEEVKDIKELIEKLNEVN